MTGADLRCECGEKARDVAPDFKIAPSTAVLGSFAVMWRCRAGHKNITGYRPDQAGIQQQRCKP